jgi:hypothetical protein
MALDSSKNSNDCNNKPMEFESESVINRTLDIFLFGPILTVIPKKYVTRQFISGFLLSIFLITLYASNHLLCLDFSVHMIALYAILIFTAVELTRKNFPILNAIFSTDQKSQNFFKNIESMTDEEMHRFVKFHIFSSKCINKMLLIVREDVNRIPPDILEFALTTQDLTKENLDLIFSKEILIDERIVIHILCQKINQLTDQNIINIYDKYNNNEVILKLLFATQNRSKILNKFRQYDLYYVKFQKEQKHKDFWLTQFSPSYFYLSNRKNLFINSLFIFSFILSPIIDYIIVMNTTSCVGTVCPYADKFVSIIIPIWMIVFMILMFPLQYTTRVVSKKYFKHYLSKVENS